MANSYAGSLIFDTHIDTDGFSKGINKINSDIEKTEKNVNGLSSKFNSLQKAIIDFGKQMVETAANLQDMDAQFERVFQGVEREVALEAINRQAKELGIHADRLTGSFTAFGMQLKGLGMDSAQALEATEKATKLAADAAAFYNVSLQDSSASLARFLEGNFEAGYAIGMHTDAKKMDIRANEMYAVSWDQLNEVQRQWLLLDTVEKAYELNGVLGQSAREQDNLRTVTENLSSAWDSFLGILGSPYLEKTVDVIKILSDAVVAFADLMSENGEKVRSAADLLLSFFAGIVTYHAVGIIAKMEGIAAAYKMMTAAFIMGDFSGILAGLKGGLNSFAVALGTPAARIAIFVGTIVFLIQTLDRLKDVWGSMSGLEKVASVLATLTTVAFAAAIAFGVFKTAATMGIAAVAIAAGVAVLLASIQAAESRAKASASSSANITAKGLASPAVYTSNSVRSTQSLPHLATGAVIPPNAEFAAILGDQRHGRNLEAPEGLIRQIMHEELSKQLTNGGAAGNLTAIFELDGREFARATAKYNSGENMRRGVRLIEGVT